MNRAAFYNQQDRIELGVLEPFIIFSSTAAITNSGINSTNTVNGPVYIGNNTAAVTGFNPAIALQISNDLTSAAAATAMAVNNEIRAIPPTFPNHAAAFVDQEIVQPGVYNILSAVSMAGTVHFDAQGDSNAVWILQIIGACALGAAVTMNLMNKALASNIFIVCDGAYSAGAGCRVKGTIISASGAVDIGADCIIDGRLIAMTGAITTANSIFNLPS